MREHVGAGLVAGLAVVAVDLASGGGVGPVIVALLLAVAFGCGILWQWRGWDAMLAAWVCVPGAHFVRHVIGMSDAVHPTPYASIARLAAFTLAVSALGLMGGAAMRAAAADPASRR